MTKAGFLYSRLPSISKATGGFSYEKLPQISRDFINEVDFRVRSARTATEILTLFQEKRRRSLEEAKSIRFIAARFAVMELTALFDGSGRLALKLHTNRKGRYSLQIDSLRRLFPSLSGTDLAPVQERLSLLIAKHSSLIHRLMHTRHNRLAHAGISRYVVDSQSITSTRFPKARFENLAAGLWSIFIPLVMIGSIEARDEPRPGL
jgi:hypothetical protein